MKIAAFHDILNADRFTTSTHLANAWKEIKTAISRTDWPHGSGKFSIYPESGKRRGEGNGVTPIKIPCMAALTSFGWLTERLPDIGSTVLGTGDLDALKLTEEGYIAFEWETGNISSSHRALNKLFLAMQETNTLGSFLVVPSNDLKPFLTDRIGNIGELMPYFPLWKNLVGISGGLRIIVVEHDELSRSAPKIPKGADGRAKG